MSDQHVVHVRRTDAERSSVLVNVVRNGPLPLDVRLVGTEGENPYVGLVRQSQINQLRAHNYQGSEDEWKTVLERCLLHKPAIGDYAAVLEGLEMVASVGEDNQITLTLRKNISGITVRARRCCAATLLIALSATSRCYIPKARGR